MLRFKQFQGSGPELENTINAWLAQFEPDVTQMTQTVTNGGETILSFVFEESFRGQELRLAAERHFSGNSTRVVPASPDPIQVEIPEVPPANLE